MKICINITICNGVKQSGVLSPLLFNIYLERLLLKLEAQGLGCHRHAMFVGAFIYADDITISSNDHIIE